MAHPNEDVVRQGFAAFASGDVSALRRIIAPGAVWHAPGRNPLSGSYKGIEEILVLLGQTASLTDGTFTVDLHDVVANDEHAFAAYGVTARRGDRTLRDNQVLVFHLRDGRLTEVWGTAGDQYAVDAFWS